jgi:CHAT domain-containing protein/tetratricopeptide (TPR) repeat protein
VLPEALAAATRAIRRDPTLPEAHFNRALIFEALGMRSEARQAWEAYLALDPDSAWSTEARDKLRALEPSASLFYPELVRARGAFAAGDRKLIDELVRSFPQESRMWGEGTLLTDWALAEAAGDLGVADRRRAFVGAIGEALVQHSGEGLLQDAVAVIDDADRTTRATLAGAYLVYRDARTAYLERQIDKARNGFQRAEELFLAARTPMAGWAACYGASAASDLGNGVAAAAALRQLRTRVNHPRHRALSAQIAWNLARDAGAAGDWGTAVREAAFGAETFRELGERDHAAFVDATAAHALERIGDSDLAWKRRVNALTETTNEDRLRAILQTAALGLMATDRIEAAEAMLDAFIEQPHAKPELLATALADRARLSQRTGDSNAARQRLNEARTAAGKLAPALRARAEAQIELADAVLRTSTEPHAAVASLDRVIAFFEKQNAGRLLPDAYLQRARAHRTAGNLDAAIADYEAAAAQVEKQHGTIGNSEVRLSFLDGSAQLVEETIDLHLTRGAVSEAFDVADRAHALFERSTAPLAVPRGTALIEYAMLPRSIAIFCVTSSNIGAEVVTLDRRELGAQLTSLAGKIRGHESPESIRSASANLYRVLIAPVRERLTGIDELVIVPDRQLHGVPFALLYDEAAGRHLVEDFTIRLAPSARTAHRDTRGALTPAFVIGEPDTSLERLPQGRTEAAEIAAMHGAVLIERGNATRASFLNALTRSSLIHYAGHAESDRAQSYGALRLTPADGDDGTVGASEIARLSLGRNRPLVVLSACGTFRGETTHLAGMPSLARAFLTAGARAVVGTLWEVDDDVTSPLFLSFHAHLRADRTPARALREAQIDMLQSPDPALSHPSTWSPVEVLSNL